VFMDVVMWEHCADITKFTTVTLVSFLISCKHSFPVVGLKVSSFRIKIS